MRRCKQTGSIALVAGLFLAACGGSGESGGGWPSGDFVAYLMDADTPGVIEAYVSDASGSTHRRIAGPSVAGGDVIGLEWSPDRTRIAVLGDLETDGKYELYLVDPAALIPTLTKVSGSGAQAGVGSVSKFAWAPNGARIAFTKSQDVVGHLDLFTVLTGGAAAIVKVSEPITAVASDVGVVNFWWKPGGNTLAYTADLAIDNTFDLFVVGANGSGSQQCNVQIGNPVDDDVMGVAWAPDGSRLAFTYKEAGASGGSELFSCLPTGLGLVKLTAFPSTNRSVAAWNWAPDSTRILFSADTVVDERFDLFVTAADGAGGSTTLVTCGPTEDVHWPSWSPDSTKLLYLLLDTPTNTGIARVVASSGGASTTIATAGGANDDFVTAPQWSPDGSMIVYGVYLQSVAPARQELHVVKPDGSGHRLLEASLPDGYVANRYWSPDSTRLAFTQHAGIKLNQANAFTVDVAGGFARRLSDVADVVNGGGAVYVMDWIADGSGVVFTGAAPDDGTPPHPRRLWIAGAAATHATELTAWAPSDAQVADYRLK